MPPDEAYHFLVVDKNQVRKIFPEKYDEEVSYTSQDAAEFVRRGACMVVWPEE